jgi:nitric oxide reductase NorQ protein
MTSNAGYIASGQEKEVFKAAWDNGLPILLKGPTGCGKTRFVQTMAAELGRPLFTVACHEDLTAGDLVGRFLLRGGETVWEDGPLTRAVRQGGICYLDEIVEARADTTVVIHPLADHRRELNIERLGESLTAPKEFMLVVSYNPGYQSVLKDLKPSTRQRMVAIELNYPSAEIEEKILVQEAQIDLDLARRLVRLGQAIRALQHEGLPEGASTRTLISTARLIKSGVAPVLAADVAIAGPLSDDPSAVKNLREMAKVYMAAA